MRVRSFQGICSELSRQIAVSSATSPVVLAKSLTASNTPTGSVYGATELLKEPLKLAMAGRMAAKPRTKSAAWTAEGSADALFANEAAMVLGVADGVGEWRTFGLDASLFAKEILAHCEEELLRLVGASELPGGDILEQALLEAHKGATCYGSSTVLLAMYRGAFLYTLNLGDSGLVVLRKREHTAQWHRVFRCSEQQHTFNCPYQLSKLPHRKDYDRLTAEGYGTLVSLLKASKNSMNDSPLDAEIEMIPIKPNDVIIAGSDGVFDNLFETDLARVVEECEASALSPRDLAGCIAEKVVCSGLARGWDPVYKSPFAKRAAKAGRRFSGGKLDDTTVVVAVSYKSN